MALDFSDIPGARTVFRQLYNQVQAIFNWDFKGNVLHNVGTGIADTDGVNLAQINKAIKDAVPVTTNANGTAVAQIIDTLIISASLTPQLDNKVDIGKTGARFKKLWVYLIDVATNIKFSGLTASLPLKLDASKQTISAAINLASIEVTGILPIANGGTNANTAGAARTSLNAANATTYTCTIMVPLTGSISGTANLTTGAVTGSCTITAGTIQVTITP